MASYLIEIRTGGETKEYLKNLTYDVANRFDVTGAVQPRAVPHITLFGPYKTSRGRDVRDALLEIFDSYDKVPYKLEGFGAFPENDVVFVKVVPSETLQELRRDISRELRSLSYSYQPHDEDYFYDFHVTIAYKDTSRKFDQIYRYVTEEYDPEIEEYAQRISNLKNRNLMWEYDLPTSKKLGGDEATTAESWEKSEAALEELTTETDHEGLARKPKLGRRLLTRSYAKATFNW
jgi:2'-5' RNA ligase